MQTSPPSLHRGGLRDSLRPDIYMRCPACSHENPSGVRSCRACGEPLSESVAAGLGTGFDVSPASTGGATGGGTDFGVPAERQGPFATGFDVSRFENYEIIRKQDGSLWELGRGAMGITYKAQDVDLHVPVALKVINPATLQNDDALDRFQREARAAAKLRHANIASVFRLGKTGDTHFYAMEFCEGQTVHQLVERRGPLDLGLALEITRQVTEALVVAQDHGVVHRDIKPSNLMVTGRVPDEFTVKVIDFGLAKHTAADAAAIDVTISSERRGFVGTAHFASPEQLEDRTVDFRSDIYSLGVTLWFMLTGRPLFEGSLTRVVTQHIMQAPPLEKLPWLPAPVSEMLDSMLAKSVDQRPRSTRELRTRLQRCIDEVDLGMTAQAPMVRVTPSPRSSTVVPSAPTPTSLGEAFVDESASAVPTAASMPTRPPSPASSTPPPPLPPPSSTPPLPPAQTAFPQPIPQPPSYAAPPIPTARPSQSPVLFLVLGLVFFLLLAGAGFVLAPMITKAFTQKKGSDPGTDPNPKGNNGIAEVVDGRDLRDALRDAREAQSSAERLSKSLFSYDVNEQLLDLAKSNKDDQGISQYTLAQQSLERNQIDAEQGFILAAKKLNKYPEDARVQAYTKLEDEVSSAGVGWRLRVSQLLPKRVGEISPTDVHVSQDFRQELKQLQSNR